jgi:hypothetical protein
MDTTLLDSPAEGTLTFELDDLDEGGVVMIGEIPALEADSGFHVPQATLSYKSCYSSTCTWAECCDGKGVDICS